MTTLPSPLKQHHYLQHIHDLPTLKQTIIKNHVTPLLKNDTHPDKLFYISYYTKILEANTLKAAKELCNKLLTKESEDTKSVHNEFNLAKWENHDDILTDSLWNFPRNDNANKSDFPGEFISQIPQQLINRFTKEGDWVLDPFMGSGTTLNEAIKLGRNSIGIDINSDTILSTQTSLAQTPNPKNTHYHVETGDSRTIDFRKVLSRHQIKEVQLLLLHPPYWNAIRYSTSQDDLSNTLTPDLFTYRFGLILDNLTPFLEPGRHMAIVIGDKYQKGEWIPLGFQLMQEALKRNFTLKSIIVKNIAETKAKRNEQSLWRYRALYGGYYLYKHEYIFLFVKND